MSAVSSTPTPNERRGPTPARDEPPIAGVADDTIDTAGDQRCPGWMATSR